MLQMNSNYMVLIPVKISFYTALDGHTNERHQVLSYSVVELYICTGYKKTNQHIKEYKDADEVFRQLENAILTHKTTKPNIYINYIQYILPNLNDLAGLFIMKDLLNSVFKLQSVNILELKWYKHNCLHCTSITYI